VATNPLPVPTWNGCVPGATYPGIPQTSSTLADLKTAAGITAGAASAASGILGALTATSTVAAATGIGAAVVALVGIGYAIANIFSGCGQTCVAATQDANAVEDRLNAIVSAYNGAPVHYASLQRGALTLILGAFQALCNGCSDPALGDAGKRCISERLIRGGTAPWCPNPGHTGCDWVTAYFDPIANDKRVIPDPVPQSPGISPVSPGSGLPVQTQPGAPSQPPTTIVIESSAPSASGDNSAYYIIGAILVLGIIKKAHSGN
jgi:hypothetical protein